MKTYKEQETGAIEWRETEGESTTIGLIIQGQIKTRTNKEAEPILDDEGNETGEYTEPETETYSPWDELLDSGESIEWISDEDKAAQARAERLTRAKAYRDKAIDADLTALDAQWQVDPISRSRMRETISVAAATNQPAETTIPWRLSDNAWRPTTAADLTAVLVAYAYRMAHIFQAFSAWEDADDDSEFEL
jgi:hypothetical protein